MHIYAWNVQPENRNFFLPPTFLFCSWTELEKEKSSIRPNNPSIFNHWFGWAIHIIWIVGPFPFSVLFSACCQWNPDAVRDWRMKNNVSITRWIHAFMHFMSCVGVKNFTMKKKSHQEANALNNLRMRNEQKHNSNRKWELWQIKKDYWSERLI